MFVCTENKAELLGLSVAISVLGHPQGSTDFSGGHLVCWVGLQLQGPRQLLAVYCSETLFPRAICSFQRALVSCRYLSIPDRTCGPLEMALGACDNTVQQS